MSTIKLKGNGSISADREIINKNFISLDEQVDAIEFILENNLVETTSSKIANSSNVVGTNVSDALNTLNTPVPATFATVAENDTGVAGQQAYDATYLYTCVSTNLWIRTAITAW